MNYKTKKLEAIRELCNMLTNLDAFESDKGEKYEALDPNIVKAAIDIVFQLDEKVNVSLFIRRECSGEIEVELCELSGTNVTWFYGRYIARITRANLNYSKYKVSGKLIRLNSWDKIVFTKDIEDADIDIMVKFLNICKSNHMYSSISCEELISELRKFHHGQNELTPLQRAYLHLLPDLAERAVEWNKKHHGNLQLKEGCSEKYFEERLDLLIGFGSVAFLSDDAHSEYRNEDSNLDEYHIEEIIEMFTGYVEKYVKEADDFYIGEVLRIESESFLDDFDDDRDKPDWLGGMETEEEFWEHE